MITATLIVAQALAAAPVQDPSVPAAPEQEKIEHIRIGVVLDPAIHEALVVTTFFISREGPLTFRLSENAVIDAAAVGGELAECARVEDDDAPEGVATYRLERPDWAEIIGLRYKARFEQDVAAGERPGEIHNKSVDAHIGLDGVFLSDGSSWHPQIVDGTGKIEPLPVMLQVSPIEGWAFAVTGDPSDEPRDITDPVWRWQMPRPVDGVALAGNMHEIAGRVHTTEHGPVEVVMHVSEEHAEKAPMFIDAACAYLDLYTPLLGPFPYRRFTIVENFFSSGFAYPGFTLLGPQVVGMAPRSLAPGYLDHELVHNWWGNGVYVDPDDGNWCEALTSYCANYYRRLAEDGEEAARAYRRGTLMKLSTDPGGLDDGLLGRFGRDGGPGRFVGYDKGAFVFAMLEDVLADAAGSSDRSLMWTSLRRFATEHMGCEAGWRELQAAFEAAVPDRPAGWLDGFFDRWVRQPTVPRTIERGATDPVAAFAAQYDASQRGSIVIQRDTDGSAFEIDPQFRLYRVLPPAQIIPTYAGTQGVGGMQVRADASREEVRAYLPRIQNDAAGENLLLIGRDAIEGERDLISRAADPIRLGTASFTVGGVTHDRPEQTVLHTMPHPDRPGRFITVFHANGDAGWSRLRLIGFYTRDSSIIWQGERVAERRVYEPDRRIRSGG